MKSSSIFIAACFLAFAACANDRKEGIDEEVFALLMRLAENGKEESAARNHVARIVEEADEKDLRNIPSKENVIREFESAVQNFRRSEIDLPIYMQELVNRVFGDDLSPDEYRAALILLKDFLRTHTANSQSGSRGGN